MTGEVSWYVGVAVVGGPLFALFLVLTGFFLRRPAVDLPAKTLARLTFVVVAGPIAWFVAALLLAHEGVFRALPGAAFPPIALGIALPIVAGVFFVLRSKSFGQVLDAVPQHWLVGIQVYRTLGIVFLVLHGMAYLPGVFAWPAGYGDILVGVLALPVALLAARAAPLSRPAVFGWNLLGIGDLIVAVATGFLSSPGPFQLLSLEAPNRLMSEFPLVMIPLFAVPMSIVLHACSLRKLRRQVASTPARRSAAG